MKLTKPIQKAIDEGLGGFFWWQWEEEFTSRTCLGGYTLRTITERRESGEHRTRKLYQTIDYDQAKKINDELNRCGLRIDDPVRRLETPRSRWLD